uniref:Uncharacterized protein n=1 Tax=Arundo donax TaxID=35708 RepID=A0A0A9DVM2_ARUDO
MGLGGGCCQVRRPGLFCHHRHGLCVERSAAAKSSDEWISSATGSPQVSSSCPRALCRRWFWRRTPSLLDGRREVATATTPLVNWRPPTSSYTRWPLSPPPGCRYPVLPKHRLPARCGATSQGPRLPLCGIATACHCCLPGCGSAGAAHHGSSRHRRSSIMALHGPAVSARRRPPGVRATGGHSPALAHWDWSRAALMLVLVNSSSTGHYGVSCIPSLLCCITWIPSGRSSLSLHACLRN